MSKIYLSALFLSLNFTFSLFVSLIGASGAVKSSAILTLFQRIKQDFVILRFNPLAKETLDCVRKAIARGRGWITEVSSGVSTISQRIVIRCQQRFVME